MQLPYVVQYLLTLHRQDGSPLVFAGMGQGIVQSFPAGQTVNFMTSPAPDYAHIAFGAAFGPRMVPDAFYATASQSGGVQYQGTITDWFCGPDLQWFAIQTQATPSQVLITNKSAFNQYYEGYVYFLRVLTHDDYFLVMNALDRIGTSLMSEQGITQVATLLRQMQAVQDQEAGKK